MAFLSRLAPVQSRWTRPDRSRRCRWLSRCVAARDAQPHPVHVAFVTNTHGRLEAPMDRIGLLAAMGLWPKRCVAGTARRDFAGSDPREAWSASCRTVAGSLRSGSRAVAPWWLPSVGTSPWPTGNRFRASRRCACRRVAPGRACADVAARRPPSPPVRFVSHGTCRVFTRRSRVRVPRFRRRCAASSGVARTGRSNVAAPVGGGR